MAHDLLTLTVAAMCMAAILSPRVPTGIVPTIGLAVVAGAALWSLDDFAPPDKVADMLFVGLSIAGAAGLWRCHRRPKRLMRRASDWQGAQPRPLTPDEQRQAAGGTRQEPAP